MASDNDPGNVRSFAAGLLLGVLIGAGVALLFAPQSGEATRRLLKRRSKRLAADAQDQFDDIKGRIREARRRGEEALTD